MHVRTVCNFNAKWEYQIPKYNIIICKVSQRGMKLRVLPSLEKTSSQEFVSLSLCVGAYFEIWVDFLDFVHLSNFERILRSKIGYAHETICPKYWSQRICLTKFLQVFLL